MKSKLARMEAFSGDGPAAVWASERRKEPASVRRPQSYASLLPRTTDPAPPPAVPPSIAQSPSEILSRLPVAEIIAHLPGAVALLDRDMIIRHVSNGWSRSLRLPDSSGLVGHSFYDYFEDCADYWRRQHHAVLAGESVVAESDTFERPDGLVLTLTRTMLPVRGQGGTVAGMLMTLTVEEMSFEATTRRNGEVARLLAQD